MQYIVIVVAVFILSMGISTIIQTQFLRTILSKILNFHNWIYPISILRIIIGICFVMASGQTSSPIFVLIVGYAVIAAGLALPIIGVRRIQPIIHRVLSQKDYMLRIWGFLAMLFGIALALAGMPG